MVSIAELTDKEIRTLPGVKGLKVAVAGPFVQALRAEDLGDHALAEELLSKAIAKEVA